VAALALTAPITPPGTRNGRIWPALDATVMTALAADPQDRYQTVAGFAQALRQASRRGTGLGGVGGAFRLTLPIFRKTAIVNPYEGPTGEVRTADLSDWPTDAPSSLRTRALPTAPARRRLSLHRREPSAARPTALVALLLGLAIVVVMSSLVLLRAAGAFGPSPLAGVAHAPTATSTATATASPTATLTPSPTVTPSPTTSPTPAILGNTAFYLQTDTSTLGTWRGHYGTAAFEVFGDGAGSLPPWIVVSGINESFFTWAGTTSDPRALQKVEDANQRAALTWYSGTWFEIDVNMSDNTYHRLALYCVDWDTTSRAQTVQILDGSSGAVLTTEHLASFHSGVYLVWKVSGHVLIKLTHTGGYNAVASGLFVD